MNVFDRYYTEYDRWYDKNRDVFNTEVNTIKKFNPEGKGIEIGTGTGRFARALDVECGIDPSAAMLKLARSRGVRALQASGEDIPCEDERFDFAMIIFSLCFMENPLSVLKETRRVLKKNGLIVSGIINRDSKWGKHYIEKNGPVYSKARFYTPQELIDLYKQSGFSYTSSWQSLFRGPDEFKGLEEPRVGFDRGGFVAMGALK